MRNWDPLAIFIYLTGVIPMHASILILLMDGAMWQEGSLYPNFPDQNVMDSKKFVLRFMFLSHLAVLLEQLIMSNPIFALLVKAIKKCCRRCGCCGSSKASNNVTPKTPLTELVDPPTEMKVEELEGGEEQAKEKAETEAEAEAEAEQMEGGVSDSELLREEIV